MTARRRSGGREARQRARAAAFVESKPFLTRRLAPYEVLDEERLATIEAHADRLLAEVGMAIADYPEAPELFAEERAGVDGTQVRFPDGMCRQIVQASAPSRFTQHARNPQRSVEVGDPRLVFAPAYGCPFVRDLDGGRRYATIEDFRNFAKLTYMSPALHHAGRSEEHTSE